MKKKYNYIIVSRKIKNTGGSIVTANVLCVKRGNIVSLGTCKWDTNFFKGEKSVVYKFLFDLGLVNKKEFNDSRGNYSVLKSKISINEL